VSQLITDRPYSCTPINANRLIEPPCAPVSLETIVAGRSSRRVANYDLRVAHPPLSL